MMKKFKKNITILLIISTTFIFSQEKMKEIKLAKKESLNFFKVADDGSILFKTNKEVYGVVYRTYKDNKLFSLDKNLDNNFTIKVAKTFPKGFLKLSSNLEYTINADQLIDREGNIKKYPYGKKNSYTRLNKKSRLNPIFLFFNDYAWTVIGSKFGRFNAKKKYGKNDIFIFNLRNKDLKGETFVLKTPEISSNRKTIKWLLAREKNKKSFFLFTRDKLKMKDHIDNLHIAENNYKGEIVSYSKLTTDLGNKFFITSNGSGNSTDFNKFYIDEKDATILVYGYYSNKKGSFFDVNHTAPAKQGAHADGIYAFKYDKSGKLQWKTFIPFIDTIKTIIGTRSLNFTKFGEKGIFDSHQLKLSGFFQINLDTGKLIKGTSTFADFFFSKKIFKNKDFLKLGLYTGFEQGDYFKDKKTNKNKIHKSVLNAIMFKPEIKDFILDRTSKNKNASYAAYFSNENIYLTEKTKSSGRKAKETKLTIFKF